MEAGNLTQDEYMTGKNQKVKEGTQGNISA